MVHSDITKWLCKAWYSISMLCTFKLIYIVQKKMITSIMMRYFFWFHFKWFKYEPTIIIMIFRLLGTISDHVYVCNCVLLSFLWWFYLFIYSKLLYKGVEGRQITFYHYILFYKKTIFGVYVSIHFQFVNSSVCSVRSYLYYLFHLYNLINYISILDFVTYLFSITVYIWYFFQQTVLFLIPLIFINAVSIP